MNDYGPKDKRGYRYTLVVVDSFGKFGWTITLKNKYAQSITEAFPQIVKTSKRKPNLFETDDGKKYVNKMFSDFLQQKNLNRYSRHTDKRAVFAERFIKTIRNL